MVRRYEEPIKSPVNILSSVYEVLTILGNGNFKALSRDYSAIAQGIKIIERDPFNDISLEEIAAMCNISSAGFRRNFKKSSFFPLHIGEKMIKFVLNDDRCLRESSANGRAVNGVLRRQVNPLIILKGGIS